MKVLIVCRRFQIRFQNSNKAEQFHNTLVTDALTAVIMRDHALMYLHVGLCSAVLAGEYCGHKPRMV